MRQSGDNAFEFLIIIGDHMIGCMVYQYVAGSLRTHDGCNITVFSGAFLL